MSLRWFVWPSPTDGFFSHRNCLQHTLGSITFSNYGNLTPFVVTSLCFAKISEKYACGGSVKITREPGRGLAGLEIIRGIFWIPWKLVVKFMPHHQKSGTFRARYEMSAVYRITDNSIRRRWKWSEHVTFCFHKTTPSTLLSQKTKGDVKTRKMAAKLCSYRDLYLSCSSFLKLGYLKLAYWAFELCENTKSLSLLAQGRFVGQHIRLFTNDLVENASAECISNYAVANLHKVVPTTKEL